MIETFAALVLAHMLGDFPFQNQWVADGKTARRPLPLIVHVAVHVVLSVALLGAWHPAILGLAAAHLVIDLAKSFAPKDRLWPFLADQAAHLATIGMVAALWPALWSGGLWAGIAPLPGLFAAASGLIAATQMGGYAVGLLMGPFAPLVEGEGLPDAGKLIGLLERGLVFLLVMAGQPAGIGFLIAAKSILRFDVSVGSRRASEYIIVGTLASFGWGIAAAYVTLELLEALSAHWIPALTSLP